MVAYLVGLHLFIKKDGNKPSTYIPDLVKMRKEEMAHDRYRSSWFRRRFH